MLTIHRFQLAPNAVTEFLVPDTARVISCLYQAGRKSVSVFCLVDTEDEKHSRRVAVVPTGGNLSEFVTDAEVLVPIGTASDADGFETFHVFQIP